MNLNNYKTIIVLDRNVSFLEPSNHLFDFDVFNKSKTITGLIPITPISKSLWTCNVEASLEYARIVYDIFPSEKYLQFITTDIQSCSLNSWNPQTQNIQHIINSLASKALDHVTLGRANRPLDHQASLLNGITTAIKALCEPTKNQLEKRLATLTKIEIDDGCFDQTDFNGKCSSVNEKESKVVNKGRIICFTSFKSIEQVKRLEELVLETLICQNQIASDTDGSMALENVCLVLVDTFPIGRESKCGARGIRKLSPLLSSELHTSQSGKNICVKAVSLVMKHFQLSLTTVTGIPMKEEQNALSSANYDVELLHLKEAHCELFKLGTLDGIIVSSKEIFDVETVSLKWCTPKSTTAELHQCFGAYRITPVDVNSRPSSCLTNFLLSGRSVMLEQPRKSGVKVTSHMLSSHGDEIFIHCLATWRSILEDPPSISEGAGGRLTDYRITDFGEFMKENRLMPCKSSANNCATANKSAKIQLERMTRHWPLVISETFIFNMPSTIEPLPSLLSQARLTESQVQECKNVLYRIVSMETKNEILPPNVTGGQRSGAKGQKRDEVYRQVWAELEKLVRCHSDNSPGHTQVLECLLACRKPTPEPSAIKNKNDKPFGNMTPNLKLQKDELNATSNNRSSDDAKRPKLLLNITKDGPNNLLDLWNEHIRISQKSKCLQFTGRQTSGLNKKYQLYQHLKIDQNHLNTTNSAN